MPGLDHALHRAIHPSDPALLYRLNKGLAHLRASIPALAPLRWANAALWRVALLFERHSDPASLQSDEPTLPLVFPLLGANAGIRILIWPARSSVTPLLLPDESFRNAVTGNTRAFEIATMAGPLPLGGFLVAFADFPTVVLLGAALGCAFLGLLRPVRCLHPPSRAAGQRTWRDVFAGAEFIWRKKVILGASTPDLFAVLPGGAVALLAIYADQILHGGPIGFGWLRAAPSIGAFDNVTVVVRPSLVQRLTPDSLRGRVTAVNQIFIGSSNEIGALRAGLMSGGAGTGRRGRLGRPGHPRRHRRGRSCRAGAWPPPPLRTLRPEE